MIKFLLVGLLWSIGLAASLPSQGQAWQWAAAQSSGTAGLVEFTAVALDEGGNTVVAGSFRGTVTLGTFTLTSAGGTDGIVARLSPAGVWLQATSLGGPNNEAITAVAVSAAGAVWVAGGFNNTLSLGGATLTGGTSVSGFYNGMFLANWDAGGQWQHVAQAKNLVGVDRILPEANGDILLVGNYFDANTTFGTVVLPTPVIRNTFVARYRPGTGWVHVAYATNGSYLWVGGIALDATGTLVLAGYMQVPNNMPITFGAQTVTVPASSGNQALFVARFGLDGTWTQLAYASPGASPAAEVALALDTNGDALVAGSLTTSQGTFGALTLQNPTGNNAYPFLARLNAAGSWVQVQGGVGPGGRAILNRDGSYTRFTEDNTSFEATATTATGVTTPLLRASSSAGIVLRCTAMSPTGQLVMAGTFSNPSATFGSLALTTTNQQAAFVASAAGRPLAAKAAEGPAALLLFPNPARHAATLRLPAPIAKPLPVAVFDALGHLVRQQALPAHATEVVLDLAGLSPGLYLVRAGTATSRLAVE
ncbi:T9SS type A sorting domain-containing protein [Hymenobacter setariae]|uniref:T9SS type A sorting domain-containing protein n=1 Tax=Hymenobacter setariae TaxID=2594794 RepID=A0A558C3I2_9BACT|nr:T9SS type A sorting domain-containing protein [Hymenobacter setariae]TVT43320.1 T9SS type A sorting domain-containing protein [Hymenobacter setariae]